MPLRSHLEPSSRGETQVSVVKLPIIPLTEEQSRAAWQAPDTEKLKVLQRVFSDCGYSLDDVPEAWGVDSLGRWTWLVLEINEIPYDPEWRKPLGDFGVDMKTVANEVRAWVWFLA